MNETRTKAVTREESAVDDIRRIRARFDQESGGDIGKHIAESRRITEQLREKLGLKPAHPHHSGRKMKSA